MTNRVSASDLLAPDRRSSRPATEWVSALKQSGPKLNGMLGETYGRDENLMEERRAAMLRLAEQAATTF